MVVGMRSPPRLPALLSTFGAAGPLTPGDMPHFALLPDVVHTIWAAALPDLPRHIFVASLLSWIGPPGGETP